MGIVDWQLVLYCAGPSPTTALRFVHFVLQYKLQNSSLSTLPDLHVHMVTGTVEDLPAPRISLLGRCLPGAAGMFTGKGKRIDDIPKFDVKRAFPGKTLCSWQTASQALEAAEAPPTSLVQCKDAARIILFHDS